MHNSHALRSRSRDRRERWSLSKQRYIDANISAYHDQQKKKKTIGLLQFAQWGGLAMAVLAGAILLLGSYENKVIIDEVEDQITSAIQEAGDTDYSDPETTQPSLLIPETDTPSVDDIYAHTAPDSYPKRISIDGIGLLARVGAVGLNEGGEVGVPVNVYDASWYTSSSPIGETPGSSVIVGHVGFRNIEGVFHDIDNVEIGQIITVTTGDDTEHRYRITDKQAVELGEFSMSDYLSYQGESKSQLHLITCTGSIIPGSTAYDARYVVSAELL